MLFAASTMTLVDAEVDETEMMFSPTAVVDKLDVGEQIFPRI
jgi:hypothetical protein